MSGPLEPPEVAAALADAVGLGERCVQVAAYLGDELIVDAWTGPMDRATVFPLFSTSKAITALAVHVQAERGLIDLDAPIARVWPEYAAEGKGSITPRHVLAHRAGVPQAPPDLVPETLGDWDAVTGALARMAPLHEPGTVNAYHTLAFGWLLGELVRRSDPEGRTFAGFVEQELCRPLGVEAFWFGIPDDVEPRVATLDFPEPPPAAPADAPVHVALPPAVALAPAIFNRADVHRACVPAVGAIADARSTARLFSVFAGRGCAAGIRFLAPERVDGFLAPRPDIDHDVIFGRRLPVGVGGLWIEAPGVVPAGGGPVLAHPGAGGSVAWAELDRGLSVAICHDRMFGAVAAHPFAAIGDAVRAVAYPRR